MSAFDAALKVAAEEHEREVRALLVALHVAVVAPETLSRGPETAEQAADWDEFEANLREALRLARLCAFTLARDVERIAVDDARRIMFDALDYLRVGGRGTRP